MATSITKPVQSQEKSNKEIRTLLEGISRKTYTPDQGVIRHLDPPNQISIPERMRTADAAKILNEKAAAEAEVKPFVHDFDFRPMDGANAVRQVMLKYFGTTGRGLINMNADITINVSPDEKIKVPWGVFSFAPLNAKVQLDVWNSNKYGDCFRMVIHAPGEMESAADGFAVLVQEYLEQNSIYKGKSFTVTKDKRSGFEEVEFLRLRTDNTIVYNEDVEIRLRDSVWGTIEFPLYAKDCLKVKTNLKVLLHGDYGTGKSEALRRTAQLANGNDRTFIMFPTKGTLDDLERTIAVARQHQPAVIAIEDIDSLMNDADPTFNAKLSNLIDGVETKEDDVMIMMTSNKVDDLPKHMTRRGRIDVMAYFGPLDRVALERMVRGVIGEGNLDQDTDFDQVFSYMESWTPSFIRGTFEDAKRAAGFRLCREAKASGQEPSSVLVLTTEDFVSAAIANEDQYATHMNKSDRIEKKEFEDAFISLVSGVVLDSLTAGKIQGYMQDSEDILVFQPVNS